jgi:hypothetical protein
MLNKYNFVNHISVYMLEDCKGSLEEEDFLKEYMEVKKFLENK